jgi:uncharacterized protein DUF1877
LEGGLGLACTFHRVTEEDIERLLAHPGAVREFLDPEGAGPRVRDVKPKGILGFLLRLTPIKITEVDPDDDSPYAPRDPDRVLDIGEGWHGLHFLLTGTAEEGNEPADFIMLGGEPLDDEGFARAFRPPYVQHLARHFEALSAAELGRRYDPRRMTELEISPERAWTREREHGEPRQWLLGCYEDLRRFVARTAAAGDGLIVHVA